MIRGGGDGCACDLWAIGDRTPIAGIGGGLAAVGVELPATLLGMEPPH